MQFATNHLGHFALTTGLHDALAADGNARIVVVGSSGHLISPVVRTNRHAAAADHVRAMREAGTADLSPRHASASAPAVPSRPAAPCSRRPRRLVCANEPADGPENPVRPPFGKERWCQSVS
jgi:NAD(P)-dependent dehydrogenase (short-subunit alcohol dehydrogenase family)